MPDERCRIRADASRVVSSYGAVPHQLQERDSRGASAPDCRPSRRCSAINLFGSRAASGCSQPGAAVEGAESVDAGIRHVEFLDSEIAAVERLIAKQALSWPEIRRLMDRASA